MHWKSWKTLSKPKDEGGLGFKDIKGFNIALLGKQPTKTPFWQGFNCKIDPLNASLGSRPSFAWKSIHSTQGLIKQGARAVVGSGETIEIWQNQ